MRLDHDNEPQPDALLRIPRSRGGQSTVSPDGRLEGAPELVVEVTASTASDDLHDKLRVYRRSGVREYVVWRVGDEAIDWFTLDAGTYDPQKSDPSGVFRSREFPGLWLDSKALIARDLAALIAGVDAGTATPEHAEFVRKLDAGAG